MYKRQALDVTLTGDVPEARPMDVSLGNGPAIKVKDSGMICLLYTSDAADERSSVDLGGRRIIKKTKR